CDLPINYYLVVLIKKYQKKPIGFDGLLVLQKVGE
ncbi:MAG: hypothetical protein ACI8WW_002495, partial [Oceanospirillaceae bacterium]